MRTPESSQTFYLVNGIKHKITLKKQNVNEITHQ